MHTRSSYFQNKLGGPLFANVAPSIKAKGVFLGGVFVQATIIYVQASVSQCWQAVSTLHYIQDTGLHYRPVRASVGKQCSVGQNSR